MTRTKFEFIPPCQLLLAEYRDGLGAYYNGIGMAGGASPAFARIVAAATERGSHPVAMSWHPTARPDLRVARWCSDGDTGTYYDWRIDVVFLYIGGGRFFRPDWRPYAMRAEQHRFTSPAATNDRVWREVGAFTEPRNPGKPWGGLTSHVVENRLAAVGITRRARWLREHRFTSLLRENDDGQLEEAFPEDCPGGCPDYHEANLLAGVEALAASRRLGKHQTVSVKWMPPRGEWRMV